MEIEYNEEYLKIQPHLRDGVDKIRELLTTSFETAYVKSGEDVKSLVFSLTI